MGIQFGARRLTLLARRPLAGGSEPPVPPTRRRNTNIKPLSSLARRKTSRDRIDNAAAKIRTVSM